MYRAAHTGSRDVRRVLAVDRRSMYLAANAGMFLVDCCRRRTQRVPEWPVRLKPYVERDDGTLTGSLQV